MRDLLDTRQLQHPLRAGYEAVALGRVPRAWQKPLRPASALRRSTAVAPRKTAQAVQAVQALAQSPPRQVGFLPGCY
jgi:hypothetical protein